VLAEGPIDPVSRLAFAAGQGESQAWMVSLVSPGSGDVRQFADADVGVVPGQQPVDHLLDRGSVFPAVWATTRVLTSWSRSISRLPHFWAPGVNSPFNLRLSRCVIPTGVVGWFGVSS
jgi:hypothetical protein